jgi:hypothetical protein
MAAHRGSAILSTGILSGTCLPELDPYGSVRLEAALFAVITCCR